MLSLQHYLALQEARARKMSYVDIGHQDDAKFSDLYLFHEPGKIHMASANDLAKKTNRKPKHINHADMSNFYHQSEDDMHEPIARGRIDHAKRRISFQVAHDSGRLSDNAAVKQKQIDTMKRSIARRFRSYVGYDFSGPEVSIF